MSGDLLAHARKQADRSSPPVRAAALMRIARVQSASDSGQARITFEMALDEVRNFKGREREYFFEDAQRVAAAFAPELLPDIPFAICLPDSVYAEQLVSIMLQNGHIDAAFDFVVQCDDAFSFPFGYASNLMQKLDDQRRLAVLRSAIAAWRVLQLHDPMRVPSIPKGGRRSRIIRSSRFQFGFIGLFKWHWKTLPLDEALAVVREIVRNAMEQPDRELTSAGYGQDVQFTSGREYILFEILHILRHLDAQLAKSVIASHEQLAAAARRFPNGIETIHEESEERRKQMAAGASCSGGFIMTGNSRDFAYQMALRESSNDGDFGPSFEHALERYREDTAPDSPNQVHKTFWPSTCAFRTILYRAGKRNGPEADILLDRIPDDDLRLFAQIELAAALAGMPELPETQRKYRPRHPMKGTPMRAADGSTIRCPKCGWVPVQEARWGCKCGHVWNTFETRGLCPACQHQWEVTLCYGCHETSRHADWYHQE